MAKPKLLECHFLIPLTRDSEISDGSPHEQESWAWLENELMDQFEGWRLAEGMHRGAWRSGKTGQVTIDVLRCYFIALRKKSVGELKAILRNACSVFGQQCVYLSVESVVEFVEIEQ